MTRAEAEAYIRAHPAMFKGASEEDILSRTQSSNDPNYYNPSTYDPAQGKTVVKPNTASRGATVGKVTANPVAKAAAPALPAATNALTAKLKGSNALPWILGALTLSLGAGMALYKVSR